MAGGSPGFGYDSVEVVDLGLGTAEGSEPLLREFSGSLVLSVTDQLDNTLLIWGESSDLLDDLPDESSPLGELSLASSNAGLELPNLRLVTGVGAAGDPRLLNGHCC